MKNLIVLLFLLPLFAAAQSDYLPIEWNATILHRPSIKEAKQIDGYVLHWNGKETKWKPINSPRRKENFITLKLWPITVVSGAASVYSYMRWKKTNNDFAGLMAAGTGALTIGIVLFAR